MEIFLLILDEIDDAVAVLRMLLPRLLGLTVAVALFVSSIAAAMRWPAVAIGVLLVAMLALLLPAARQTLALRFKTDP